MQVAALRVFRIQYGSGYILWGHPPVTANGPIRLMSKVIEEGSLKYLMTTQILTAHPCPDEDHRRINRIRGLRGLRGECAILGFALSTFFDITTSST